MQTPRQHPIPDERQLWIVALAPPVLWASQFLFGYFASEIGCRNPALAPGSLGWSVTTVAILGVTLLAEVLLVWSGWTAWRILRSHKTAPGQDHQGYRRFMAGLGIWLAVIFGITILATGLAALAVSGCA